jgi:SpoIID/LytB domain protein
MTRRWFATIATVVAAAAGSPVLLPATAADAAAVTYYRPGDGVLHLAGHGFGHGHGLSQWGAYGGAISGQTYRQILNWYYASPAFGSASGAIKVQITADGRNGDGTYDVVVRRTAGLTAVDSAGNSLALPGKDAAGTAYDLYRSVLLTDGTVRVQAHAGSTWTSLPPAGTGNTVTSWTGWVRLTSASGIMTLVRSGGSDELYREILELDKTSSGSGVTVNRLSLEHYLAGVVSSEMPCGWTPTVGGTERLDALEAQAVAARSYAAWRRQHRRTAQVDIVDTTSDQAYHGYSAEKTALTSCPWTNADGSKTSADVAAVTATAGQVLVDSNAAPLFAQYSASNGGFETAGGQSYLPARPDAWDGVPTDSWNSHSWTDSITAGQIQAAYPSIGTFTSLTVNSREALSGTDQNGRHVGEQWGGRITSLTVSGSKSAVTTSGGSFASALSLTGPWFTVVVTPPGAPQAVSATGGDAQATVRWAAPKSDGGGGIRSYTITASPSIPPVTVAGSARSAVVTGLTNDRTYTFSVSAINSAGAGTSAASAAVTPTARVLFHPLAPKRILDTHKTGGAIGAGMGRSVNVLGVGGVPSSGVVDVALNVVSLDSTAASSLTAFPHGGPRPASPQLTWVKGQRVNTLVWVKVGSNGAVDLTNATGSTHVLVDVEGYYTSPSSSGDVLTASPGTKLFDSRTAKSPVPAGATRTVQVVGRSGVPAGATAAVVQLTAVRPSTRDYVRAWSAGGSRPQSVALYAPAGVVTSATAIVPLTSAGAITISPIYAAHLVVSLEGWFASPSAAVSSSTAGVTSLVTPTRRVLRISLAPNATKTVSLPRPAGIVTTLVTIGASGPAGTLVYVWAAGQRTPPVSTMSLRAGWVRTARVSPIGSNGGLSVHNSGRSTIQIVVDVAGWA